MPGGVTISIPTSEVVVITVHYVFGWCCVVLVVLFQFLPVVDCFICDVVLVDWNS